MQSFLDEDPVGTPFIIGFSTDELRIIE